MLDERTRRILRQHVETDWRLGVDAVPLGSAARAAGSDALPVPAAAPGRPMVHAPAPTSPRRAVSSPPPAAAPAAGGAAHSQPAAALRPREARLVQVVSADDARPPMPPPPPWNSPLDRPAKLALLQQMNDSEVRDCRRCKLFQSRTQTVFGEGDPDASLMFVGEGPGQTEDETGRPFVGRAGELLTKMIGAIGLKREQVYIANTVKCRPPNNRTPAPDEVDACSGFLVRQIMIVRPRVIVSLGGPATKLLLNNRLGITAIRGTWHEYRPAPDAPAIPVMPTFHPAYLLRNYNPETRRKVWSDLQKVQARLDGRPEPPATPEG